MISSLCRRAAQLRPRRAREPRAQRGPLPVLFVITSMPVGGAEVLLTNLIEQFDPARIQPEIVCLKEPGPLGERMARQWPVHSELLRGKWDIRVLPRLVHLMRVRGAAAVVTVGAGDKMFWGRLSAWAAGVPVILSALHSTGWPDGVGRMNRLLTPLTDGFIAVADQHAEYLRTVEAFPAERVHAIRNGVDTSRFVPDSQARISVRESLGIPDCAPVFGIVAALRPEKNHGMFLRVASRILERSSEARFIVVGDGPERSAIESTIERLGIGQRVHMLGTRHDTPAILAALDAFLLCSHNEASPVSILEALACEVPVVATRIGSVGESVIPEQTGFLVDVDDDAAMAAHAQRIIEDRAMARRWGEGGRALVCRDGSLDAMVRGYTALIESVYDRSVARGRSVVASPVKQRGFHGSGA